MFIGICKGVTNYFNINLTNHSLITISKRYTSRIDADYYTPRVTPRKPNYIDKYWDRHRSIVSLRHDFTPILAEGVWIAPSANVLGCVELWQNVSVWFNAVIRADVNFIRIGKFSNVQDRALILESHGPLSGDHDGSTIIGHYVTVGHGAILKSCTVEDQCTIGMGAILEEGSYMEIYSALGANSVLKKNQRIPSGELWLGNPAKFLRKLEDHEIERTIKSCVDYAVLAETYQHQDFFSSVLYREKERLEKEGKLK